MQQAVDGSDDHHLQHKNFTGHALADYPEAMLGIFFAAKTHLWRNLLKAMNPDQVQRLLQCARDFQDTGKRKWAKALKEGRPESLSKDTPPRYLYMEQNGYIAKVALQGLNVEVSSPRTASSTTAAFYHSVVVELKMLVSQRISSNPYAAVEDSVQQSYAQLCAEGLSCPLNFRTCRHMSGKNHLSPMTDDVNFVLEMRQQAHAAPSLPALKRLMRAWKQEAECRAEQVQGLQRKADVSQNERLL